MAQIGLPYRFEEIRAFLLEAVQTAPCRSTCQADFHRQVEHQGQVRAQVALDEALQFGDARFR
ncbi:hypothetical protein D9M73_287010 [compost metagenome]